MASNATPAATAAPPTRGAKAQADVTALLRARNTLLWVVTREECRVERALIEAAVAAQYQPRLWDCADGVTDAAGRETPPGRPGQDPQRVLSYVQSATERSVWILRDMHAWIKDPVTLRTLRNTARQLQSAPRDSARALIVLTPSAEIPPELTGHATVIDWPLPDRAEVATILDDVIRNLPPELAATAAANGTRDAAIDAAVGLSAEETAACYARSLVTSRRIDPALVSNEKKRVIAREKVLEWYDPLPGGLESVGGLEILKAWLVQRRAALSARARAYGIKPPKGVLLVGVPGCGKSLTAKAIATAWGVPLLKLDLGALRSKYVGESEANIRKALQVAEAVAPCVLWLDEIEKALAGSTGPQGDGGVSADALGAVLGWLQERSGSVFVVATANDVRALPPELLRKGRFDEVFWVDLPTPAERAAILAASLRSEGRDAGKVGGMREVAALCDGFSGAELAALVPDAMLTAFADGERPVTAQDLANAARSVVPQSRLAAEKLTALREWARGRARPASAGADTAGASMSGPRNLDL